MNPDEPAAPASDTPPMLSGDAIILARLQQVDGIDVAVGLAAVGGHVGVYCRLLARFIQTHEQDARSWLLDVDTGDPAGLRKQAHRVQGAAATLGLINIDEAARRFGVALSEDVPADERVPLAAQLALSLEATLRDLRAIPEVASALSGLPPAAR